ncbi:MAG: YdcF family protein [Synechococcales bacterium]|nr:YdcF family protein [Synechococcales bacterium]
MSVLEIFSRQCRKTRSRRYRRFCLRLAISSLCLLLIYGPLNLAIAHLLWPQPDGLLVLGGHPHRETTAAQVARQHPQIHVWSSSGLGPERAYPIFQALDVSTDRVTLDYRAVDTVTNFTTLVNDFKAHRIRHLYLVTSDYHMPRACAIATIILGSYRIAFTPVVAHSHRSPESPLRILRDMIRSWLWLVTRWSGASLRQEPLSFPIVKSNR